MRTTILSLAILLGFLILEDSSAKAQVVIIRPRHTRVVEVRPVRPYPNAYWHAGEWEWRPGLRSYVWVGGRWEVPVRGTVWVRGHWRPAPGGYVWVPGHWR